MGKLATVSKLSKFSGAHCKTVCCDTFLVLQNFDVEFGHLMHSYQIKRISKGTKWQ